MYCKSEVGRDSRASRALYSILLLLYISVQFGATLFVPATDYSTTAAILTNNSNSSLDDNLYVIKAVVYEIGILTDAGNTTEDTTERQEEVKISFYKSPNKSNES